MLRLRLSRNIGIYLLGFVGFLGSGCCKKGTCPTPPPPTKVERAKGDEDGQKNPKIVTVNRAQEAATREQVSWFRKMSRNMLKVQGLLAWHTRTRGERSILEATYAGREILLSRKALARLEAYLKTLEGPQSGDERLATEYLRDFLAQEYIRRKTAPILDDYRDKTASLKVKVGKGGETMLFRELPLALSKAKDPKRRVALQRAASRAYKETLNPILMKRLGKEQELAQWMGFKSYFALAQQIRRVETRKLLLGGDAFMKSTDEAFMSLMKRVVRESLQKKLSQMTRSDHLRLMRAPKAERFLPRHVMVAAFKHFLEGIGLDLTTAAGTQVKIDDLPHPKKTSRAACFPIEVPRDVRVSVKPKGGVESWATLFHEGGHALHFAWTKEKRLAFQKLGNGTATEAYAELFARVWAEPKWLERYRRFVRTRNRNRAAHQSWIQALQERPFFITAKKMGLELSRSARRRRRIPLMSQKDMAYVIRHRLAWDMYLYRRYGWAKLIYEGALHGADDSLWDGIYKADISDRKALYRDLFSRAYGYSLRDMDAQRYLADVDPFLYAADYARAFLGADRMIEHLRKEFGDNWFENKKVGPYLKKLWAKGTRWTAEGVVKKLGYKKLDYSGSKARFERLWKAAQMAPQASKGATKPRPRSRAQARSRTRSRPRPRCAGGKKPDKRGMCPIPIAR